jgi:hypothetical protein
VAAVRLIAVVGLGIDAYVHLDLASTYSEAEAPISEGILFRAEAVLALLTALALILSARRLSFLLGFVVSASALTLMLVSRYVDLGSLGPFPDLYDPVWFAEKLWAAFGEAAASIASLAGILLLSIRAGLHPTGERGRRCPRINREPATWQERGGPSSWQAHTDRRRRACAHRRHAGRRGACSGVARLSPA